MRILRISALLLACASGALALSPALSQTLAQADKRDAPQAQTEKISPDRDHSEKFAEWRARRAERLAERLKLTDAQKAAFKDLQDARAKAHADARTALGAGKPDLSTFEKRIGFREAYLQAQLDALKAVAPKEIAFYNSLDDKQKQEFEEMQRHGARRGWDHGGGGWGHRHRHGGRDDE
ncbi:Spy/CpxP family protein refolding chaperone [uncultured Rhodoblastus sp.]|uniref:Spy/CpxP family protein refolding chaperone n=1 Tax=uncultured Rhodoblastus sp. TaxID=543037 RepID=UPI0025F4F47B|nr:Spy/CpxP family protein refolding chaperone [uncultured Rhodoblastus sp.]